MRRGLVIATLALALSFGAATPAHALLCDVLLGCSCTVTASPMSFGSVDPLSASPATATSDVHVSCTGVIDIAPSVTVKVGPGTYGVTADRQMQKAGGQALHYNIYDSTLYSSVVGSGTGGFPGIIVSGGLLNLGSWSATTHLYGRAPSVATTLPGAYSDTVTVRIDW